MLEKTETEEQQRDGSAEDWPMPPSEFFEDEPTVEEDEEASKRSKPSAASRRQQKRAEKAAARSAHNQAHTRELRAAFEVMQALPQALPSLKSAESAKRLKVPAGTAAGYSTPASEEGNSNVSNARGPKVKHVPDVAEVEAAVEAADSLMRTGRPYRALEQVFGPAGGLEMLASMIERPQKYQDKYLDQEWSILAKVWALAGGSRRGEVAVVDIGAGNGCLALLAGVLLGGYAVLIDHTLPPEPLRVEDKIPEPYRSRVLRVTGDVADLDTSRELEPLLAKHGIRQVVVIAKHLCGVGTDLALRLVSRWCQGGLQDNSNASKDAETRACVLGAVFATCCGHKIGAGDRNLYAGIHAEDLYLKSLTHGNSEHLLKFLGICTRCVAWRTTAGALQNRIMEIQVRIAELFEDALQQPRLNMLQRLFPSAVEVAFVPQKQSPQNRCLIAGCEDGIKRALATGDGEEAAKALAALAAARDELRAVHGGAVDLRPHGFVSSKYDFDGS